MVAVDEISDHADVLQPDGGSVVLSFIDSITIHITANIKHSIYKKIKRMK